MTPQYKIGTRKAWLVEDEASRDTGYWGVPGSPNRMSNCASVLDTGEPSSRHYHYVTDGGTWDKEHEGPVVPAGVFVTELIETHTEKDHRSYTLYLWRIVEDE